MLRELESRNLRLISLTFGLGITDTEQADCAVPAGFVALIL